MFCLVCGKIPKQPNASPFYDVDTSTLPTGNSEKAFTSLSKKLRDVIKVPDTQRNQLVPSKEVCKKCFRQLVDIDFMENQIKRVKEEMMGNFLATVTKVSKMGSSMLPLKPASENTYTTTSNTIRSSTSSFSLPQSRNLDESSGHRQNASNMNNHNNRFATSSSRSVNSVTNSYPWELPTQAQQGQIRKHTNERQQSDNINYGVNQTQQSTPFENMMFLNNERLLNRGRRFRQQNTNAMPSRSASHDPGGSSSINDPAFGIMMNQQNVQYPEIPSVPSSNNGDVGTSNVSDSYQIYRRARSSPPRLTDIPTMYYAYNDKMDRNNEYQEEYKAPVNLSSNSSSGNEVPTSSTMTMAAVSAERCTDWVKDSRACAQKNELIKDNHYSIKDVKDAGDMDSETKNGSFNGTEQGNIFANGISSGSGEDSTLASCGSTPPMAGASDYSKNSSDTDTESRSPPTPQSDERDNKKDQHKRVHYQDHKLSAKSIKQHQKQNRRLQRSPMKLVQGKPAGFQKPIKSKKLKASKHHGKEAFDVKKEEISKNNGNGNSDSNGTSDSNGDNNGNGPSEWTRSSSNTPSPPTSFGSVGSNDNSSSTDPSSNDTHQQMSTHFPKPFWKKRYCEDSSESSTQQSHDNLKPIIPDPIDGDKIKLENGDASIEQPLENQIKRRKIEISAEDSGYVDSVNKEGDVDVTEYSSSHLSEDINKLINTKVKEYEKQRSTGSSPRSVNPNESSNLISTDSGHESRGSD